MIALMMDRVTARNSVSLVNRLPARGEGLRGFIEITPARGSRSGTLRCGLKT
ncbi:MAG: hypothetical protein ACK6CT_08360 [Planctomycetia bacterium]